MPLQENTIVDQLPIIAEEQNKNIDEEVQSQTDTNGFSKIHSILDEFSSITQKYTKFNQDFIQNCYTSNDIDFIFKIFL